MNMSVAEKTLSLCKEKAKNADLEVLALILHNTFKENPEIKSYVTSKLPAIILENLLSTIYLERVSLDEWFLENTAWQNSIREASTIPSELGRLISIAVSQLSVKK